MTQWIAAAGIVGAAAIGMGDRAAPDSGLPSRDHAACDTLEVTAAHEAGHVAVAREFGIPVWHVEARGDGNGETVYPDHYFRDPVRDAYNNAVIDVSGQESAAAWLVDRCGYTPERALDETESSSRYDLNMLREDSARAGISEREARDRAQGVIQHRRSKIDRTAQRIVEHGGYLNERDLDEMERS